MFPVVLISARLDSPVTDKLAPPKYPRYCGGVPRIARSELEFLKIIEPLFVHVPLRELEYANSVRPDGTV